MVYVKGSELLFALDSSRWNAEIRMPGQTSSIPPPDQVSTGLPCSYTWTLTYMDSMSGPLPSGLRLDLVNGVSQQRKHREEEEKVGVFIPLVLFLIIPLCWLHSLTKSHSFCQGGSIRHSTSWFYCLSLYLLFEIYEDLIIVAYYWTQKTALFLLASLHSAHDFVT